MSNGPKWLGIFTSVHKLLYTGYEQLNKNKGILFTKDTEIYQILIHINDSSVSMKQKSFIFNNGTEMRIHVCSLCGRYIYNSTNIRDE